MQRLTLHGKILRRLCYHRVASLSSQWRRHFLKSDKLRLTVCSGEGLDGTSAALFHSGLTDAVRECRLVQ